MKKYHYRNKEHLFVIQNHFHMYIFYNSYTNYDKTRNPPITFQGDVFRKVLGVEVFYLRGGGRVIFFRKSDFDLTPNH